jgi:arylsulfatase A-like enzyme
MKLTLTVACTPLKSAWQGVCRPSLSQIRRLTPLRSGSLRSALTALLLAPLTTLHADASPKPAKKPNVIFILADDLGWGDLGCYGNGRIRTPNLDKLAQRGTLFTQFYVNGSVCSPSRAAFMTGQFPARNRIHTAINGTRNEKSGTADFLDPKVYTVTSLLKADGYVTGHFGKWHLAYGPGPSPTEYGVDDHRTYATAKGAPTWDLVPSEFWPKSSELIVDETLRFIRANRDKPFYVNLWSIIPHAALNPTAEQMRPYEKLNFGKAWDRNRGPGIPHKDPHAIYFASVTDLDTQLGRLFRELDAMGLHDDTLVVFSSDNGPEVLQSSANGYSAGGSAGPFRGRKRSIYEGGVRVPFIVSWPGHVPAGRIENDAIISGVDLLPTVCKLAGTEVPAAHNLDGEDVSDLLLGAKRARAKPLYWEWRFSITGEPFHRSPMLAMREGHWKLLMNPDRSRVELFDIPHDPTELLNVAKDHPEVVQRMSEKLIGWSGRLPPGPLDASAGKNDYPWPVSKAASADAPKPPAKKGNSK